MPQNTAAIVRELYRAEIVVGPAVDLERRQLRRAIKIPDCRCEDGGDAARGEQMRMEGVFRRVACEAIRSDTKASTAKAIDVPPSPKVIDFRWTSCMAFPEPDHATRMIVPMAVTESHREVLT